MWGCRYYKGMKSMLLVLSTAGANVSFPHQRFWYYIPDGLGWNLAFNCKHDLPPPKCAIPKVEHLTNVQTDFLLQICNTSVPIIEKFICRSSILLLFFNLKKSGKNDKMWGKNYVIKKALVTFDTYLKFPLYMKTHFQRFFAHKHYFYMSYSGRNSHSRTVFSIFDQFL